MPEKASKLFKCLGYILSSFTLFSIMLFGLAVYFTYTWLAGYSPLYALLGNLVLIFLGLVWNKSMVKFYQSKRFMLIMIRLSGSAKEYREVKTPTFDGFVSFKTALYIFYIVIMIVSQIVEFYPMPFSGDLLNFIAANKYSILFLFALDRVIELAAPDRENLIKSGHGNDLSICE